MWISLAILTFFPFFSAEAAMLFHPLESNRDLELSRWKHRSVVIFLASKDPKEERNIRDRFASAPLAEIEDRDIKVFLVSAEQAPLRRKWKVDAKDTTTLLIGKDGGEKERRLGLFALEDFFPIIDAMPMRQREMKSKSQ